MWADADDWFEKQQAEEQLDKLDEEQRQKAQQALSDKFSGRAGPSDPMQPDPSRPDPMAALEAAAA